jgi:hypothetical protein
MEDVKVCSREPNKVHKEGFDNCIESEGPGFRNALHFGTNF